MRVPRGDSMSVAAWPSQVILPLKDFIDVSSSRGRRSWMEGVRNGTYVLRPSTCILESRPIHKRDQSPHKLLQTLAILAVETACLRSVQIENTTQDPALHDRHHDFRARGRVAGDVAGKGEDVWNDESLPARRGCAADTLTDRDPHAGRLALKGSQDQLLAATEIKAAPVDPVERLAQQSRGVGQVRDRIGLTFQERSQGKNKVPVQGRLGLGSVDRGGEHAGDSSPHYSRTTPATCGRGCRCATGSRNALNGSSPGRCQRSSPMRFGHARVALPCPDEKSLSRTGLPTVRQGPSWTTSFGAIFLAVIRPGVRE